MTFQRAFVSVLLQRLQMPRPLIQLLTGPRQEGKTTGVRQLLSRMAVPQHYANADDMLAGDSSWLLGQWQHALAKGDGTLLVIDEIQKIPNWPETVKAHLGCPPVLVAGGFAGVKCLAYPGGCH